mgnify:CR=1 FL=1
MATRRTRTTKPAAIARTVTIAPVTPKFVNKLSFLPMNATMTSQSGDKLGPFNGDVWVWDDVDGDYSHETCIKVLIDDYIPDELHTMQLVLQIADLYRAAKGL